MNKLRGNSIMKSSSRVLRSSTQLVSPSSFSLLRQFSTETHPASSIDAFIQRPSRGVAYGRLLGITRKTLKSDVINMLKGCALTPDNVRVDYNHYYVPMAMLLQFPSGNALDNAFKSVGRNRLYRMERGDPSQWDILTPYNGKYVLLQGVPMNAVADDVERFLSGCDYDSSSLQFMLRANNQSSKMALVRFTSPAQAMNAYITKNRCFCLNSQITLQVLQ